MPDTATEPTATKLVITPDVQIRCVKFHPSGHWLAAAGCDGTVRRWAMKTDEPTELPSLTGHDGWTSGLAFSPDGKRLFSADSWGRLIAWDTTNDNPKPLWQVATAHDGWVRKVDVSPDGAAVLTCGSDGLARTWSADVGAKPTEYACGEPVFAAGFHPGGKYIVTGGLRGVATKWHIETGKAVGTFDASELSIEHRLQNVGGVRCLAFSADGKLIYVGGTKPENGGNVQGVPHVFGFDWATGKRTDTFLGPSKNDGFVYEMAVRPSGKLLAVTSGQPGKGQLLVWTPGTEEPTFATSKMPNCHGLSVHPDGDRVAVAATNGGSNGNGKREGEYKSNYSPIHVWMLPAEL